MDKLELIVPTLFGLESFAAREIRALGYETSKVEDGRITFMGDWEAVCRCNMWLRTGERVLIKVAEFKAVTFDELFEQAKAINWSDYIGKNAAFPIKGYCLKSTLASMRDCQAIIKKAMAVSLSQSYGVEWLPEDGATYQIQFSVLKDIVTLMIDTSGQGLHKRGYRAVSNAAPIKETIAAAMIKLSYWKYERPFADLFCGSGTLPIEAAMIAQNIAPGLSRSFLSEGFEQINPDMWKRAKDEAYDKQRRFKLDIYAADIDKDTVEIAAENARKAGVDEFVKPVVCDMRKFSTNKEYGTVITNPPYGERMGDTKEIESLYRDMKKVLHPLTTWSYYVVTSNEDFEKLFSKKADKRRKVYNGMLKCNIYQYFGPKPPRIERENEK